RGNDGVITGGATLSSAGVRGGALALNGGSDGMFVQSVSGPIFPRTGTFSIHFRHDMTDTGGHDVIDQFSGGRSKVFLRHANSDPANIFQAAGQYPDASASYAFVSNFTAPRNVWTHVVVTWSEAG